MRQRLLVEIASLPVLMRLGLAVLAVGASLDVTFHASSPDWQVALEGYLGTEASLAHLVTLSGMVLTIVGVLSRR